MIKLPGKAKHTCDPWRLGEFYHEMECKAWDAAIDEVQRLNATAQPVSDGCKVPNEPTPEMQTAGATAIRFDTTPVNKLFTANAVYRAMLAAAPGGQDD